MFDIIIIGAGPAGLFAIFEAGMLGLKSAVVDSLESIGGQCSALYPEKPIYDIPAYPKILAQDLVERLHEQAAPFQPSFFLNQQVVSIKKQDNNSFDIETSTKNIINAKAVIIAAGGGAFGPNKPLIDNIEDFEGKSVLYTINKRTTFVDKRIVIAGGGDSAIDWALSLAEISEVIYLVHRREKFRAPHESMRRIYDLVTKGKIELVIPYQLHSLSGDDGHIKEVIVSDLDKNLKTIKADYLLPFFGLSMNLGPISEWGLGVDNKHIIVNPSTMETNIPGIFAIGDIITYPGKLKLILTGFAEAALACNRVHSMLNDGKEMHFEYSTTKGIPGL